MPARLSVAMIVRDEALMLPECLAQARPWVSEIVCIDTGSRDDTRAIAEAAGCVVGHFSWCDDFAAARNAGLDACTGDWVFVIDADERLTGEDWARLGELIAGGPAKAWRFVTRNYTNECHVADFVRCAPEDPLARGFAGWFPSTKVRLFPNTCGARFSGTVHELLNPALEAAGIPLVDAPFPVHHYPLLKSPEAVRAKQEHYAALGRAKVAAYPQDVKAHLELAAQYVELGQYAGAIRAFQEALRLEPNHAEALRDLGAVLHLTGQPAPARQALELAVRSDPAQHAAWRNLGVVLAHTGDWSGASAAFARACEAAPGEGDLHRLHALALLESGHPAEAEAPARRAVASMPWSQEAAELFAAVNEALQLREP
jgi:Flp pilus assembly protein TadD